MIIVLLFDIHVSEFVPRVNARSLKMSWQSIELNNNHGK